MNARKPATIRRRLPAPALSVAVVLAAASSGARARASDSEPRPPSDPRASSAQPQSSAAAAPVLRTWSTVMFLELATGFVPVANDVPLMLGVGVRAAGIHEVWARIGYMPVGDDIGHGFGVVGYRAALRPGRVARPILGGFFAGLPATCGHDSQARPSCTPSRLFIFSAVGGIRVEPVPWLGFSALVSLGIDTYPNPFGMVELAATYALDPSGL
jgi:hypothetical protein